MEETTTIKLTKKTKARLDNLKVYKHETYEEVLVKMLEILNLARNQSEQAKIRLIDIDKERKRTISSL